MTKAEKYKIKDQILRTVLESDGQYSSISRVTSELETDFDIVCSISDELIEEKLLENRGGINAGRREWRGDKMILITPKGRLFLNTEGGFEKQYSKETQNEILDRSEKKLNRLKIQTDIAKNVLTIVIAVVGGLYTMVDFMGKLLFANFDLAEAIINFFKYL